MIIDNFNFKGFNFKQNWNKTV